MGKIFNCKRRLTDSFSFKSASINVVAYKQSKKEKNLSNLSQKEKCIRKTYRLIFNLEVTQTIVFSIDPLFFPIGHLNILLNLVLNNYIDLAKLCYHLQ